MMEFSGGFAVTEFGVFNIIIAYFLWEYDADEYAALMTEKYPHLIYKVGKV